MQSLSPSIYYRGTNFTAAFTNALGAAVTIEGITINETIAGSECDSVNDLSGTTVKAGGAFTVKASGCPVKADGEAYDIVVKIAYNVTMGGISTNHTDMGAYKRAGRSVLRS